MLTKLFLALRNNGHQTKVVKLNGETRPQLGRSYPEEENRRANAVRQWGMNPDSPRHRPLATIDEPLPRRTQTILSNRVPKPVQEQLDSGRTDPASSRHRQESSVQVLLDASGEDS